MASRLIAYGLLLFFGLLGAHQFYLGRSLHGIVMLCSLGGFFAGWLHDLFNLERYIAESEDPFFASPKYWQDLAELEQVQRALGSVAPAVTEVQGESVQQAMGRRPPTPTEVQDEPAPRAELRQRRARLERSLAKSRFFRHRDKKPHCSWSRYFGECLFGLICGTLWLGAWPADWFEDENKRKNLLNLTWPVPVALDAGEVRTVLECAAPLAMTFGVFVVGNIGTHKMDGLKVLACSYASFIVYSTDFNNILYGSLLTTSLANWFCRSWRTEPARPRSRCGRAAAVGLGASVFYGLLLAGLLFNARVTYEGKSVPLKDAVKNFFKSPLWREMSDTMGKLYEYYKVHGFKEILKQLWDALDPQGLKDAASVIGLPNGASLEDIKTRCRKLKVENHPDKQKEPELKLQFQEKFQEISAACDILMADGKRAARRRDL